MRTSINDLAEHGACRLRDTLGGHWRWRLLSHAADGQAVFEYCQQGEKLIGKFCTDAAGGNHYRTLQTLARGEYQWFRVPRPLDFETDTGFLVTSAAPGWACHGMSLLPNRDSLLRIGRALRELHASPTAPGPTKSIVDHLDELVRPSVRDLAKALPRHAPLIQAAADRLHERARAFRQVRPTLLHRDFHLRQLFDDGHCITVVDWDLAAWGDPAFDVAYFTTYLRTHYDVDAAEAGVTEFLRGYAPDDELVGRLATYELFNYLRRACRRFRLQDGNWRTVLDAMLARVAHGLPSFNA